MFLTDTHQGKTKTVLDTIKTLKANSGVEVSKLFCMCQDSTKSLAQIQTRMRNLKKTIKFY